MVVTYGSTNKTYAMRQIVFYVKVIKPTMQLSVDIVINTYETVLLCISVLLCSIPQHTESPWKCKLMVLP